MIKYLLSGLSLAMVLGLFGCAGAPGEMIEDSSQGRTVYSKYFDGADWLVEGKLGLSVVIDNDTPVSQQMFGGFVGKDTDGVGTVTLYFWNLSPAKLTASAIHVTCDGQPITHAEPTTIGPGPFARTGLKLGTVPFSTYTKELRVKVSLAIDGTVVEREITAVRRTVPELKKYWGPGALPPYPWFTPEYAAKRSSSATEK